ncbi:MAG: TolB family protein, partial [Planctomycetaceae bacterium]
STPADLNIPGGLDFRASPDLSSDGLTLFFSQTANLKSPTNLWFTSRKQPGAKWSAAQKLSPMVNSIANDEDPSLSPDGLSLLFTSNRDGGQGGRDLWVATRDNLASKWNQPMNLGAKVNSQDVDAGGTFVGDNLILFSSSRGANFDIWMTSRTEPAGEWSQAVRIEGPINSEWNEKSPSFSNGSLTFISDRPQGRLWNSKRTPFSKN